MLFDIDWQGAQQVRERLGDDVVAIFILPPSMGELRARLERRAEDSAATIAKRLEAARQEIERWRNYDYVIVNDDLQRAYRDVLAIITAERLRASSASPPASRRTSRPQPERMIFRLAGFLAYVPARLLSTVPLGERVICAMRRSSTRITSTRRARSVEAFSAQSLRMYSS